MTMDIRQAGPHLSAGAGRGLAKMDGAGKLSNKIALITGGTVSERRPPRASTQRAPGALSPSGKSVTDVTRFRLPKSFCSRTTRFS
jgi:hypothetical protein